jgi:hypothetical protein
VRRGTLGLALVAACGPAEGPDVRLELPPGPQQAALLAIEVRGAPATQLWALDLAAPQPALAPLPAGGAAQVTALLFEAPLADLDLTPGPLVMAAPGDVTRPLPVPDTVLSAAVEAGAAGAWTRLDALPGPLAATALAVTPRCRATTPRALPGAAPARLRWAIPYTPAGARGPDRVLLGLEDDSVWMAGPERLSPLTWVEPEPPSADAALMGRSGRVNLTVGEGELWQAEVDLAAEEVSAGPHGLAAAHFEGPWLTGPPATDDELYILASEWNSEHRADNGNLVRYFLSGTPGAILHYFAPDRSLPQVNPGDVAWVGPETVLALWPYAADRLVRFADGGIQEEPLPGPQQVEHVPGWGAVVGTESGRLYVHRGEAWTAVAERGAAVRHLAGGEAAAWGVDADGALFQLVPELGLCAGAPEVPLRAEALVALRGAVVVLGRPMGGGDSTVAHWFGLEP